MRSSRSGRPDEARRPAWLTAAPYAHRGLHGQGRVENSRSAFEAAIAAGFGIECDLQIARDGEAAVFHDYELGRLTAEQGRVSDLTLAELQRVKLAGSAETIPSLPEVLELIGGRAPVLLELKRQRQRGSALCPPVLEALRSYQGQAAVMSFDPQVGQWFSSRAPKVIRGLVVTESGRRGARGALGRWLALWGARPDFLAYDIRDLPSRFASRQRALGLPILTWTVRSGRDEEVASACADQIIHELPPR
ncbi:MAG TPA: glycerophosphodiester phosphodiesterase family protein [Allosphingosinicella sp.]|nr:glycerophosphodiester phosphodiesterase family protein [Allosphingosinicella sp.]